MKNPVDRFLPLDAARHTADAYGNHAIDEFVAGRITRRELLRHASVIGLALAGGGVLLNTPGARAQGARAASVNGHAWETFLQAQMQLAPMPDGIDGVCSLSNRRECFAPCGKPNCARIVDRALPLRSRRGPPPRATRSD